MLFSTSFFFVSSSSSVVAIIICNICQLTCSDLLCSHRGELWKIYYQVITLEIFYEYVHTSIPAAYRIYIARSFSPLWPDAYHGDTTIKYTTYDQALASMLALL